MGRAKQQQMEEAEKEQDKIQRQEDYHRRDLVARGVYSETECIKCNYPLSHSELKDGCPQCGSSQIPKG